MKANNHFAEVIESSLTHFIAQSWEWDCFPTFGQLISATDEIMTVVGIVHQIMTGSIDPSRQPFTFQKTQEELMREQPQIFEFLKTNFSCIPIGYIINGKPYHLIPYKPLKIHTFIGHATIDQVQQMLGGGFYLNVLFGMQGQLFNLDELLLALMRYQATYHLLNDDQLKKSLNTYCLLIGNDYRRIKLFTGRLEELLH